MDQACKSGWGLILACSLPNNFCVKRNRFVDAFRVLDLQLVFFFSFRTLVSTDTAISGHMYIKHREFQGCHAVRPEHINLKSTLFGATLWLQIGTFFTKAASTGLMVPHPMNAY